MNPGQIFVLQIFVHQFIGWTKKLNTTKPNTNSHNLIKPILTLTYANHTILQKKSMDEDLSGRHSTLTLWMKSKRLILLTLFKKSALLHRLLALPPHSIPAPEAGSPLQSNLKIA